MYSESECLYIILSGEKELHPYIAMAQIEQNWADFTQLVFFVSWVPQQ